MSSGKQLSFLTEVGAIAAADAPDYSRVLLGKTEHEIFNLSPTGVLEAVFPYRKAIAGTKLFWPARKDVQEGGYSTIMVDYREVPFLGYARKVPFIGAFLSVQPTLTGLRRPSESLSAHLLVLGCIDYLSSLLAEQAEESVTVHSERTNYESANMYNKLVAAGLYQRCTRDESGWESTKSYSENFIGLYPKQLGLAHLLSKDLKEILGQISRRMVLVVKK